MKPFFPACGLFAALVMASCSPETLTMNIEMRHPSSSGLDLARKTIAIVYPDASGPDTLFNNAVATGLARSLEADYFGGEEAIHIYKVAPDSVNLDRMHQLVMDTGDDVVFLLDNPVFGEVRMSENASVRNARNVDSAFIATARIPYSTRLFVYDSMEKESDAIHQFSGNSTLRVGVFNNGTTPVEFLQDKAFQSVSNNGENVGAQMSNRFVSTWKTERYSLYYYDDWDGSWVDAAEHAYRYEWDKAIRLWTGLVKTKNYEKRACASYNIALAFYMLGDLNLAEKWLDEADKAYGLSLSPGLRKRIGERRR